MSVTTISNMLYTLNTDTVISSDIIQTTPQPRVLKMRTLSILHSNAVHIREMMCGL